MKSKVRRKENYIETGGLFIDATFSPIPFVVVESVDIQTENGNEDKANICFLLLRDCYPCNTLSRFENEKKAKIRKEAAGTQMKGSNNSRQEEKKPHCIECNLKMAIT